MYNLTIIINIVLVWGVLYIVYFIHLLFINMNKHYPPKLLLPTPYNQLH